MYSVLAAGYVDPTRQIIHGKKLPPDHVCVLLTTAQQNIKAPFLADDERGKLIFGKRKVFCFPKKVPLFGKSSEQVTSSNTL